MNMKPTSQFVFLIISIECLIVHIMAKKSHRKKFRRSNIQNKSIAANSVVDMDPVNAEYDYNSFSTNSDSSFESHSQTTTHHERKFLDADTLKVLLKDLVDKLDNYTHDVSYSSSGTVSKNTSIVNGGQSSQIYSHNIRHCNLHGLWLSAVAGAAIELMPEQQHGHIEIHTKIFELPDNPYPSLINSQWTGKGMISQESPTTITIIFQQHIDVHADSHGRKTRSHDGSPILHLPRTAVFVGQCLVCHGNPMLQGTWVVFPQTQSCTGSPPSIHTTGHKMEHFQTNDPNTPDIMYLLRK